MARKIRRPQKWVVLSLVVGSALGCIVGILAVEAIRNPDFRARFSSDYRTQIARFGEALRITHSIYPDQDLATYEKLTEQAIAGMAESLDQHSKFFPPEEFEGYKLDQQLKYAGAGFRSRKFQEYHFVTRVFPGSPARKAGLKTGDRVVQVDGEEAASWTPNQFHSRLRGPAGTRVRLEVSGPSGKRELEITRAPIRMNPIDSYRVDANGIGYVRLDKFTPQVGQELKKALKVMQTEGMRSLIIDLRWNPGGYVESAVKIAGYFLKPGTVVTTLQAGVLSPDTVYRTKDEGLSVDIPMAILVNSFSASGSECLAGTLRAHGRAILVGEKTFGKGSVQATVDLSHRSGLRLTIGKYYLSDETNLDGNGVEPDNVVSLDKDSLIQLLVQRDHEGIIDPAKFETQFGVKPIPDPQLIKAIEILSEKTAAGEEN